MFVRKKRVNSGGKSYEYLQIVENERVDGKVKQRVVATLGRSDLLAGTGKLDNLATSLSRHCDEVVVVNAFREGSIQAEWSRSWGPVLVFRRLWERLRIPQLLEECLKGRRIEFDVDAAAFALALQRLMDPGSDLSGSNWVKSAMYQPFEGLDLQHFYRVLDVLWEHRETLEKGIFDARRAEGDAQVDLVFFDTTTLYFEGAGPASLARRGHSKDHRPQDTQVVVCVVMGQDGYPLTCEVWPGNTADVTSVQKVISTLKRRFDVRRTVLVCDRGMVSAKNLRRIRAAGMHYIIGVRMRQVSEVRREVLSRAGRYRDVAENLRVKEVRLGTKRYIVCHNPDQAERDRKSREAILERLEETLASGQTKSLVGNKGYRSYLSVEKDAVSIDTRKIKEEARFDGKFVIRTSTDFTADEVATTYKSLWEVEAINRTFKDVLETRPMFHQKADRIRGHIFGSFLSLLLAICLRKAVETRLDKEAGESICWHRMMQDLAAVHAVKLNLEGRTFLLRTELRGLAHRAFQAAGVRPPPLVQAWADGSDTAGADRVMVKSSRASGKALPA